ncbi:hypothetical protein OWR29_17425 [Actinoplanes sp. Pm04-4]|uniref:Uncharacterized protein n=1 Tax=Paractinoplanes pyxinae TaxID=2997416 RepID=A0ABT4B2A6_9ACTN|nr:hypothetical protein [Actinoplanes pyxinae]MCY1139785.1 hypothetical protein [Actinoplanes pyxinae]
MSVDRRRIVAVIAALAVLLVAGVIWLARLVTGDGGRAEFVAGPAASTTTTTPAPGDPASLPTELVATSSGPEPTRARVTDDPDTPRTETAPPPGPTVTTTRPRTAEPTRSPGLTPPTTRATTPPPPPVPTHAIQVGGATLDNDSPRGWCAIFDNRGLGMTVTVTGVNVTGRLRVEAGECAGDDNVKPRRACRPGLRLPTGDGCFAETIATTEDPDNYPGVVTLGLRARCTSLAPAACDVPVLRASPPTSSRPAVLEWTDKGRDVCYRVGSDHLCSDDE